MADLEVAREERVRRKKAKLLVDLLLEQAKDGKLLYSQSKGGTTLISVRVDTPPEKLD